MPVACCKAESFTGLDSDSDSDSDIKDSNILLDYFRGGRSLLTRKH